ncbi:MAG TPA: type III pantothenate kinase [Firmicutes bacterium]|nr:type III pantothenate kinase [Bacillota bacterium]
MILVLDVGNTNIVLGCIEENKTHFVARFSTDRRKTADEYAINFKNIIELNGISRADISGCIISSVVPPLTNALKEAVRKTTGIDPMVVGPGIKTGLNITIDNPAQLGSDLVVDAVAALAEYKAPLIVIDLGTATTVSVVDALGNYVGGLIYPGVKISQEALSSNTSQLPSISLEAPKKVIGKNTIDCMKSGLINGSAAMIDGIIDRIEDEIGQPCTVVATGGLSNAIVPHCRKQIIIDDTLLLKGLLLIYKKNS